MSTERLPENWREVWAQRQRLAQLIKQVSYFNVPFMRKAYGTHEHDLPEQCNDCGVQLGELHVIGCANERCPICARQFIVCGHREATA
ncbi:hypothetical protein H010_00555 [Hydrogenophaga taeniospiralis CCUG 15921]|uniref:Uncharacterized protein n=1 Tax=Hydrogenophaga taeniospiralis CCUG 15921 TaxID=1281780 RepID=A0A9X4NM63_9BURK|nr:hypothetical protein [Hydrogenophaga taeniospiralis]MDG5973718.1 hypothetical protein [Hydrogenophaga taeniospiralis CCUG 15921]